MSANQGDQSPTVPEWWSAVSVQDARTCRSAVSELLADPFAPDLNKRALAVPLFVLLGGDAAWLTAGIEALNERACDCAVQQKRCALIDQWRENLQYISQILCRLPAAYAPEVEAITKVIESCYSKASSVRRSIPEKELRIRFKKKTSDPRSSD